MILGAIADDFTGGTDLANTLVREGMRTVQTIGVPAPDARFDDADAIVVALKTRSVPAAEAVAESLAALRALRARGARQVLFKYCSTFDSTARGNIGPVADALLDELGAGFTLFCPAFPTTGRRIFGGYLFVGDMLLSESGMQHHPLNPMTDSNLVRVLQAQTPHRVGRVDIDVVRRDAEAIRAAFEALRADGVRHAIVDAGNDDDLRRIGAAARDLPLITGGSGIALGLPAVFRERGWLSAAPDADRLPHVAGRAAVLSGSCSRATLAQVAYMKQHCPAFDLNARGFDAPEQLARDAAEWAAARLAEGPVLISASASPTDVAAQQSRYGEDAGARIEGVLAGIARSLRGHGVARFVIAGGETSGAVVAALGVESLRIGAQIDPGVPWTVSVGGAPVALALKSGNFGSEDFFEKALACAP